MTTKQPDVTIKAVQEAERLVVEYNEREDLSEFHRDIARSRREYLGLGGEAIICGRWGMLKQCPNGHFFLSILECGREWCPNCGRDGSASHGRRIARLLPRLFAMRSVGYFVFEVPLMLRPYFLNIETIKESRRYLHRLLVREFHTRGVSRWHWYGEGQLAEFDDPLRGVGKYHPHLNVLIDYGHISKKRIKRIRRLWSKWLYRRCGRTYYKTAPVYYQYYRSPGKRYHLARYVTRATFKVLTEANMEFAKELYKFNNQSWLGSFSATEKDAGRERFEAWVASLKPSAKRSVVEVQTQEQFNNNVCPICHAPLTLHSYYWQGRRHVAQKRSEFEALRDFGGGLYQVGPPPWSGFYQQGDYDER
jgi:hypothetical protein